MFTATANTLGIPSGAVSARPTGLLKTLVSKVQLHNERRALASLDAAALNDIGVTKFDAMDEAKRSVWDAPDYWHK